MFCINSVNPITLLIKLFGWAALSWRHESWQGRNSNEGWRTNGAAAGTLMPLLLMLPLSHLLIVVCCWDLFVLIVAWWCTCIAFCHCCCYRSSWWIVLAVDSVLFFPLPQLMITVNCCCCCSCCWQMLFCFYCSCWLLFAAVAAVDALSMLLLVPLLGLQLPFSVFTYRKNGGKLPVTGGKPGNYHLPIGKN